jgi:hypothetical protein
LLAMVSSFVCSASMPVAAVYKVWRPIIDGP